MKIIAESASNHNGQIDYLMKLALAAKESNADYLTFQILDPKSFCVEDYERFDIVEKIAFRQSDWNQLINYCQSIDLEMIPCALDLKSFEFCISKGLNLFKIHATDIGNIPYLKKISEHGNIKVILETQCATYQDISFALNYIGNQLDAIIHGYSNYPSEVEDLNLNALDYIQKEFNCSVGFADHSIDVTEIPLMVLAKNAKYLEKHITISRNDRHYDWQVSLYPNEFSAMVNKIKHYQVALGRELKHPKRNEAEFRNVLYKKVIDHNFNAELKRSDYGNDYLTELFNSFSKDTIGIGIIARLKSSRLKRKVLKPFLNGTIIEDLYHRISSAKGISTIAVITSFLSDDSPLAKYCIEKDLNVFRGHPESVIDRMLSFALKNELGIISRVTGDNPFSDPQILEQMIDLMQKENLDYVKVNNAPMGVGVELYTTSYLWNLYLKMENPLTSEYLAWIALNDKNSEKGCIDITHSNKNLGYYNLSIDYQEDYDRCQQVLKKISKSDFKNVMLSDVLDSMISIEPSDKFMTIKLPGGEVCTLEEFDYLIKNSNYKVRRQLKV